MAIVKQDGNAWTISADAVTVRVDANTLGFTMQRPGGKAWNMVANADADIQLSGDDSAPTCSLAAAGHCEIAEHRTGDLLGIRAAVRGFGSGASEVDATLAIIIAIDSVSSDIVVRVIPVDDATGKLGIVRYPRPFDVEASGEGVCHALPSRQGFLLPPDYPHEIDWWWIGLANTTAIFLPWWGAIRPGDAYMAILETPYDGGMHLEHPAGGPTHVGPKWHPSMGGLSYARQVRYTLFADADHNDFTARYREYVRADGRLKTLETKATEVPRVRELEGVTVAAASTMRNTQPDSHYYDAEHPERNRQVTPFADTVAGLRRFARVYESDRIVVHLDGWGTRGYDNLHPDILPPCPEAGGWDGFRAVADVCDELGWLFATHDNYIDFYQDAETYSDDLAVLDLNGVVTKKAWWAGGAQAFLCEQNALGYVRRNFEEILRNDVKLTATYIDVFNIMEPIECTHPDHPQTREQCLRARAACFDWVRSKGIVLSSEEPTDWSVPYTDFCYWAPLQQQSGLFEGEFVGVPVPLFNGAYHDCMVTPWNLNDANSDVQFLYALSFGGAPMVNSPDRSGAFRPGELERAKILADVHRQTGFAPIAHHELVTPDGSERVTEFAGGEIVHVDIPGNRYRLAGISEAPTAWQAVPGSAG